MEKIDIINNILKYFISNMVMYYLSFKITNSMKRKKSEIILITVLSFFLSIIYSLLIKYISSIIIFPILYFICSVIISKMIRKSILYSITIIIITFTITYIIYTISSLIAGIFIHILFPNVNYKNPIGILVIFIIMNLIIYAFFKIKRFKNGFNFLKSDDKVEKISFISLIFAIIIMISTVILSIDNTTIINTYIISGTIIIAVTFIAWLQASITKKYKEDMKERTIDIQKVEIENKDKEIEELKENNLKLSSVIHRYNNRFAALENAIIKKLNQNTNTEASEELAVILEDLNKMSKNFSDEIIEITKDNIQLPTTGIMGIDNIFKYMSELARKENIKFDLKINDKINYLINNIISQEDLETMIGDHIKDAIIAIKHSENKNRNIMVILGIIEDAYELCIYDTGIDFEIQTLKNLGIKRITTHEKEGGTGIGFITTFETLRKCKGSIIIEEYENNLYTKAVIIRFDGKNEYKIRSYRAEKIKDERIIIEKL